MRLVADVKGKVLKKVGVRMEYSWLWKLELRKV